MLSDAANEYYEEKKKELVKIVAENKDRKRTKTKQNEEEIDYIHNDSNRRSKFCRRSATLVINVSLNDKSLINLVFFTKVIYNPNPQNITMKYCR